MSSTGTTVYGSANDPGDRRSGFDFRWYLPGLRRAVTIYSDSLADDEPNPIDNPRRSAWAPGIYFPKLPGLQKLDLRFETYSTWLYTGDQGGLFFYWNNQYRDAYTNGQFLLGSWVGRDARAYVGSSTYWWSAKNKVTASFRQVKTGSNFLPGGGTQTDVSVNCQWSLTPQLLASGFVQFERYLIPALGGPGSKMMVAGVNRSFIQTNGAFHGKRPLRASSPQKGILAAETVFISMFSSFHRTSGDMNALTQSFTFLVVIDHRQHSRSDPKERKTVARSRFVTC